MNKFKEDLCMAGVDDNLDPCQNSSEDARNLWNHLGRWHSVSAVGFSGCDFIPGLDPL